MEAKASKHASKCEHAGRGINKDGPPLARGGDTRALELNAKK